MFHTWHGAAVYKKIEKTQRRQGSAIITSNKGLSLTKKPVNNCEKLAQIQTNIKDDKQKKMAHVCGQYKTQKHICVFACARNT